MADVVTSQLVENGNSDWVYRFTSLSDGGGESSVTKVDGSASGPLGVTIAGQVFYPGVGISILSMHYNVVGMSVNILWDATTDVSAFILTPGSDKLDFHATGGITIPPGTVGATGKILFTTIGAAANSSYSIVMRGRKRIQQ